MLSRKQKVQINIGLIVLILTLAAGCSGKGSAGDFESSRGSGSALFSSSGNETASYDDGLAWSGESYGEIASASGAESRTAEVGTSPQTYGQEAIQVESTAPLVARKLIKQASLRIEADPLFIDSDGKLSGINQKVDELIRRYGAYVESSRSDEHTAHFTIRTPQVFYESLIAGTSVLGKTQSRTETAEDVTIKYYDLEGRLNTKKTLLTTFQGYLSRTTSIDDIMKVEARISELQNEIDWLGNQLTRLGNLVDYSTVELVIFAGNFIPRPSYTLGERIKQLFSGFGGFASNVLLGILWIIIYVVPIILICLIAYWLLFGKVGILKKLFHSAMPADKTQKKDDKQKNNASKDGEQ